MSWNYDNIELFVDQSDIARSAIIDKCRDEGYIIPSDKMRKESGMPNITITDIPNWLIPREQAIIIAKTINTNVIYLDISLKLDIPDLEIQWEYDAANPFDNILKIKDIHDTVIKHEYSTTGIHNVALFSPSKLEKVSSYAFNGNNNIKEVILTPVVKTLDSYSFFNATNLDNVYFQGEALKVIKGSCFYNTKIKTFTIPNSVETVYGGDTFYSVLDHFILDHTKSKLKKLIGTWIFNFADRATLDDWIHIPADCKFYIGESTEITNDSLEKIKQVEYNWNPLSRNSNRIYIHKSDYLMNDSYGITYLKDKSGNPICIMNIPLYDIFDTYSIPSTVKYIAYGALMSIDTNSRQIPINIPSNIEHIEPGFIHWAWKNFKFTSNNKRYLITKYNGLMTYSNASSFSGNPDVLLYEPNLLQDIYEFPENFSSLYDFEGRNVASSSLINHYSKINIIKINKKFPKLNNKGNVGPFSNNPKLKFEYLNINCDNYTIYENCLYMTDNNGNRYGILIGVPKNITSFTIHKDCRLLYMGTFYNCSLLSGDLILDNVNSIGYLTFHYTNNLNSIQIGDELIKITLYMPFSFSAIKTLKIGKTKNSKLTDFGANTVLFNENKNLTDIWITSTKVNNVSKLLFLNYNNLNKTIHIYFYNEDGSESETYKAFKKAGYSSTTRTESKVILLNIG